MPNRFTVQVPCSTSNLGSGFDALSAALNLCLRLKVELKESGGMEWDPPWPGPDENLLETALLTFAKAMGVDFSARLEMDNPIPLKRGLGSSGAAIVAAYKAIQETSGAELPSEEFWRIALRLEGHPDNLAASLRGGWVLSRQSDSGVEIEPIPCRLKCRFVLAVPELTVSTHEARSILPSHYSRDDLVFNLQRSSLLVLALCTGRKALLREAVEDRIHQPYRSRLIPGSHALLTYQDLPPHLRECLLAVTISGSGASLVALADGAYQEIGDWMVRKFGEAGVTSRVLILDLDSSGPEIHRP